MTETKRPLDDAALDELLAQMAAQPPTPDPDLEAHILADALAVQPQRSAPRAAIGLWPAFRAVLGGWGGLGGLTAAAAFGFVIGFSPPASLQDPMDLLMGDGWGIEAQPGYLTGFGWDWEDG